MVRKDRLPELLAPAGDFECLVAAVKGGADAVYVGAKSFGARAYAKNFDTEELCRAVAYCHLHGVKLYVTLNTLILDGEMEDALNLAGELYRAGVDALIVADLGLIRNLRRLLPDFELHASTQMSVHNSLGADEAYALGCTRVVLAREVSGKDIAAITAVCKAETEVFLHGALCVCHSGQCLFSSLVGGRSGNRGECAQPCRLPYGKGDYPLSLKDLSLSGHVKELIDSGVKSLKIEGRMKAPEYVFTVTSIYRKLLDENRNATEDEDERLKNAFSRGGFTDGYFVGDIKRKMTGVRSEKDKEATKTMGEMNFSPERVAVEAKAVIKRNEEALFSLWLKNCGGEGIEVKKVTVRGAVPSEAISAPLDRDSVAARLSKMGNTFFSLSVEDIEIELDEGLNLSPSAINALRREAAEKLEQTWKRELEGFNPERVEIKEYDGTGVKKFKSAVFYNPFVFDAVPCEVKESFDAIFLPLDRIEGARTVPSGVSLPPVVMESELDEVREMLTRVKEKGVKYALIGNLGHIKLIEKFGLIPIADHRFNIYNKSAAATVRELVGQRYIVSCEMNYKDAVNLRGSGIVYGRIPLMLTERCFIRDNGGCGRCSDFALVDRKGAEFPIIKEYRHRNLILNSAITYMGDKLNTPTHLRLTGEHFIFTKESAAEVTEVAEAFAKGLPMPLSYPFRRMGRRDANKK